MWGVLHLLVTVITQSTGLISHQYLLSLLTKKLYARKYAQQMFLQPQVKEKMYLLGSEFSEATKCKISEQHKCSERLHKKSSFCILAALNF